jgi:hypothetical protein
LPVDYEQGLVEASVLAAARGHREEGAFRAARDRLYELADSEARDAAFTEFHAAWFERLTLDRPLRIALDEIPVIARHCGGCIVARAAADESSDLLVARGRRPTVMIRVRPETVCDPTRFLRLLRRELLHVADMIDPAFGYEPTLPRTDQGPYADLALKERYRVLWDTWVDGRLARTGRVPSWVRDERLREFARVFPGLPDATRHAFERFFDSAHLTHRDLVASARPV